MVIANRPCKRICTNQIEFDDHHTTSYPTSSAGKFVEEFAKHSHWKDSHHGCWFLKNITVNLLDNYIQSNKYHDNN